MRDHVVLAPLAAGPDGWADIVDIHRYQRGYCIGAPLARIELQTVFTQLIPRFPTMRLVVPAEDLRVNTEVLTGGLFELPVTW